MTSAEQSQGGGVARPLTYGGLGTFPAPGDHILTTPELGDTAGMPFGDEYLRGRRPSIASTVVQCVFSVGGGDIWLVQHDQTNPSDGPAVESVYSVDEMIPLPTVRTEE